MAEHAEATSHRIHVANDGRELSWPHITCTEAQLRELLACGPEVPLLIEGEDGCWVAIAEIHEVAFHRHHRHRVRMHWAYVFEGIEYTWPHRFITVAQMREQRQVPPGVPIVRDLPDGQEVDLRDDERIDLRMPCRYGVSGKFRRGLTPRWDRELALLRERWPALEVDERGWVTISEVVLPAGLYNRSRTTVWFQIPPSYPHSGPDNFYTETGLRFADGRALTNYSDGAGPHGGQFGVFSFHPEVWRCEATPEAGDNLLTFMRAILRRLQETT